MKQLITDDMISAVVEYLTEAGDAAAQAKADRLIADHRREAVFSELLLKAPGKSADQRRAWAKSHPDHAAACDVEAVAERNLEWHRHQKMRCEAILSAWQTQSANNRGLERVR